MRRDGRLSVTDPEQAIAATLGTRTLTAEQVMAIAGKHQPDYCSDTHVCFDWQAIADELNATLGGYENDALKAENAKLRELVEYMHRCFVRGHDWGPYCAGETVWVEQRMRELGIEVDGCE